MIVDRLGRLFELYRTTGRTRTAIALVVANAIPLAGVLFFGWSLLTILVVYWIENAIVGFWNVPKILLARGPVVPLEQLPRAAASLGPALGGMPGAARVGMALFFLVHYGLFWVVHGVFVFVLPEFAGAYQGDFASCAPQGGLLPSEGCGGPFGALVWTSVAIAALALFISHGASFVLNYVGRGEYAQASPARRMGAPYGRVVILHLTIILGAFVAAFLGSSLGVLVSLVVLKTGFDLGLHLREHRGAPLTAA
ncbi:MAG: DUF6498-containing protein [Chloroflexi bacterium]|nr:DUF6498-containing protein [Chloroflexota bacterium]